MFPCGLATNLQSNVCWLLLNEYAVSLPDFVRVSVPRAFSIHGPPASEMQTTAMN